MLRINVGYEEKGVGGKTGEELMVCLEEIRAWKVLETVKFNSDEASGYVTEGVFSGKDAEEKPQKDDGEARRVGPNNLIRCMLRKMCGVGVIDIDIPDQKTSLD